jgi:hypothetical protein
MNEEDHLLKIGEEPEDSIINEQTSQLRINGCNRMQQPHDASLMIGCIDRGSDSNEQIMICHGIEDVDERDGGSTPSAELGEYSSVLTMQNKQISSPLVSLSHAKRLLGLGST